MSSPASIHAAIAAHRFGLGEASVTPLRADPQGWLLAQIGPADAPRGERLLNTVQALEMVVAEQEQRRRARAADPAASATQAAQAVQSVEAAVANPYREVMLADVRSRLTTAAATARPFAERLHLFWCNHFTVSLAKGATRGLVGAFEREAIRPNIAGLFQDLLFASTTHPAMLRYLDNVVSAGPHSRIVARAARRAEFMGEFPRVTGLNENLAREVLELHTLGAESGRGGDVPGGGYTQADVTALARVLTGWRISPRSADPAGRFDPAWHEPGRKTVLGKSYPEGPNALSQVLSDLARHPATAHFIATKLARHFVADDPPAVLVDRLATTYRRTDGTLAEVYRELVRSPEAWAASPTKLKTPEELVLSSARLLGLGARLFERGDAGGIVALGQRVHTAPSPAGWSDRAEDWLGPDALWKRVEWAARIGDRAGRAIDARQLADASLGGLLGDTTRRQIERAADGPQALALLLMSPEFQRR
jgi:uncharacterized protein (DUF1800 family)